MDIEVDRPMGEIMPGSLRDDEIELFLKGLLLDRLAGEVGGDGSLVVVAVEAGFDSGTGRKDVPGPVSADGSGMLRGSSR